MGFFLSRIGVVFTGALCSVPALFGKGKAVKPQAVGLDADLIRAFFNSK
jgi:hypothetical protein